MKYPTSLRGWAKLMQTKPGFDRISKAVRLREEAEERLRWAKPGIRTDVATLELLAAKERVRAEIVEAKDEA